MKTYSLKTVFAVVLFLASVSVFASPEENTGKPTDQVVASFDRLLNHTPAVMPAMLPSAFETDPLLAGLSAVLWEHPSYHLPFKFASLDFEPKQGQ